MVRENDFTWQFWRKCHCALDRDLRFLIEFKPTVRDGQFALLLIMNDTSIDNKSIIKESTFAKYYLLDKVKIDLPKEYKGYLKTFMDDYFDAKDKGRLRGR